MNFAYWAQTSEGDIIKRRQRRRRRMGMSAQCADVQFTVTRGSENAHHKGQEGDLRPLNMNGKHYTTGMMVPPHVPSVSIGGLEQVHTLVCPRE
jgi:hypothetical protein